MYFQIKSVKNQQNTKHRKYKPDRGGHKVDRKTKQILSVIIFFWHKTTVISLIIAASHT